MQITVFSKLYERLVLRQKAEFLALLLGAFLHHRAIAHER